MVRILLTLVGFHRYNTIQYLQKNTNSEGASLLPLFMALWIEEEGEVSQESGADVCAQHVVSAYPRHCFPTRDMPLPDGHLPLKMFCFDVMD